jgi:hypothetical protein
MRLLERSPTKFVFLEIHEAPRLMRRIVMEEAI